MKNHVALFRLSKQAGFLLPVVIFMGYIAAALVIWQSWQLSRVVSDVFLNHQNLIQVKPLLSVLFFIILARVLFTIINEILAGFLAVEIKTKLRDTLLEKIQQLGPAFLKQEETGELATTALNGVDALDIYFRQFLPQVLLAVFLPLTILIFIFPLDKLTGIVFLVTAPLIPLFMVLIGKMSENQSKRQWQLLSRLGAFLLDTLQGLSTLFLVGRSKDRGNQLSEVSEKYRIATLNVLKITFLSAFVLELVATISTAVVAVEIGLRLLYGWIDFQQAFFILLIAPEFYQPMRNLSTRFHAGMTGVTASVRIFELLEKPECKLGINTKPIRIDNPFTVPYVLKFEAVDFEYPTCGTKTLDNIDLEIESGKQYALVGESGAGKTTLAYLLMQFLVPQIGQITINNKEIDLWQKKDWHQWIGWIPQKPKIFNTTLLENVRLLQKSITEKQVIDALEKASLNQMLTDLPQGLNTPLLDQGARLSGGEIQRVGLARVFIRNCPFVILDEPTTHLDPETEIQQVDTIRNLQQGRTTITIAHRLNTIQYADEIIVMKRGRIICNGDHLSLLDRCEEYRRLINSMQEQR